MYRTIEQWKEIISDKKEDPGKLADFVLRDLFGYDNSTSYRTDDEINLINLFGAIRISEIHHVRENIRG